MIHHMAFYGKSGVGKSALVSNVSAALVEAGFDVMQVGCDSRGAAYLTLNSGVPIPTVCDLAQTGRSITVESAVHRGFKGLACVELGGLFLPGDAHFENRSVLGLFLESTLFDDVQPDYVLYDIPDAYLGDSHDWLAGQAGQKRVFVVTSADFMSLHAANTILRMLQRHDESWEHTVCGLIPNNIASSFEESFVSDFAIHTNMWSMARIPRSLLVRQCELYGRTVIEGSPLSNQSYFYRRLANQILDETHLISPRRNPLPMPDTKLREWAHEWGDRIHALENGLVADGAAI